MCEFPFKSVEKSDISLVPLVKVTFRNCIVNAEAIKFSFIVNRSLFFIFYLAYA